MKRKFEVSENIVILERKKHKKGRKIRNAERKSYKYLVKIRIKKARKINVKG